MLEYRDDMDHHCLGKHETWNAAKRRIGCAPCANQAASALRHERVARIEHLRVEGGDRAAARLLAGEAHSRYPHIRHLTG